MSCPKCKSKSKDRIKRRLLHRLIPLVKRYKCLHCKTKYLKVKFI